MGPNLWNGRTLEGTALSLVGLGPGAGPAIPIFAAAVAGSWCSIWPDRVAAFLVAHRTATFVCHDSGPLFWRIADHLARAREREALDALWDLPESGRLRDIRLLDQLIQETKHPARPHPSNLDKLAERVLGQGRLAIPGSSTREGADDPARIVELGRMAVIVLDVARVLVEQAGRIADDGGVDPATVDRFGPLAIDIQVRGSVAVAAAERAGLNVDEAARREVVAECRAARESNSAAINADAGARRCFKCKGGVLDLGKNGFPQPREHTLEIWLGELAESMSCCHDIPFTPPLSPSGRPSTDPSEWGLWVRCHPLLRTWSDLKSVAGLLHRYDTPGDPPSGPRYELIPVLRSVGPDLEQLHRLDRRPMFRPGPGHIFLVVELPNLETRALAAVCARSRGRADEEDLAEIFRRGDDVVAVTATRLLFMVRS